jgi:hypothetical protein
MLYRRNGMVTRPEDAVRSYVRGAFAALARAILRHDKELFQQSDHWPPAAQCPGSACGSDSDGAPEAAMRRSRLEHLISPEDRESFARDGFVVKRDVLPKAQFEALVQAASGGSARA